MYIVINVSNYLLNYKIIKFTWKFYFVYVKLEKKTFNNMLWLISERLPESIENPKPNSNPID